MQQSQVIEVSGQFAGAAVSHEGRFRFIAVDPRVEELDDSLWPSLPDMRRVVTHLLTTGRLPVARSLIKCHDTADDGRARFAPQTAFIDPDVLRDAPPGQGIQLQTPVVHGDAP